MVKWLRRAKGDLRKKALLIIFRFLSMRLLFSSNERKGGGEGNVEHTFTEMVLHLS